MTEQHEVLLAWPGGEPVDIDSIEGYTADARASVRAAAHPLDEGKVLAPDDVAHQLIEVSKWAERMVVVIRMAEAHKRMCAVEKDEARAQAVLDVATFPAREHSARVTLTVMEERRRYDAAVVAFEEARRVGNLLSDHTSRLQSIGKLIGVTYQGGA